jgi:hypothetical protein
MDITQFMKPVDNLFISINENKGMLILIIILLGIYLIQFNEYIIENATYLFDNNLFRLIIFIIISYISGSSPALGISLAIIMLTSMQIITTLKFKKEIKQENFRQFNQHDNLDIQQYGPHEMYLSEPLKMQKDLNPYVDYDKKLITPTDYYMQMIKKGKVLLDNSYDLEQDLSKRYDIREDNISSITKKQGIELINSGLNRLQKSNNGEYNILNDDKQSAKFIKYSKLLENISNDPGILASYNELLYNYDKLITSQHDDKTFDILLNKVYLSDLDLLETIYKVKKNNLSDEKKLLIDNQFNKIKQTKFENSDLINELKLISSLLE